MQPPSSPDDNPVEQDDPAHWLNRLSAPAWLSAAENELDHLRAALGRRAYRPAVTHARRAAGMALNAVLRLAPHERWGRSYMEHVVAMASDEGVPPPVRAAAAALRALPAGPPVLVPLGKPDTASLDAAETIVAWAGREVASRGAGAPG